MKRPHACFLIAATVSLLLLNQPASARAADRPFSASGMAIIEGNPFAGTTYDFDGSGTPIGVFTGGGDVKFYMVNGTLVSVGTATFIAANGDKLYASFVAFEQAGGNELVGPFVFTGGTGRFAGAKGLAVVVATPETADSFAIDVYGSVNY